ncbi:MAG: 2-oxo acid dehydrogenase subunit E2, partial [Sandaracinaceae bacterium]|nr:2-oxo acid dehydrogenase subunit E2 [Sandaracinaceae bacterium]
MHLSIDIGEAAAYLARLNEAGGSRVTMQHLVTAAIARSYAAFPYANATVSGRQVLRHPHVGAAMPMNLPDEPTGHELGFLLVREAETLSLRELGDRTRARVERERNHSSFRQLRRLGYQAIDRTPSVALAGALSAVDLACKLPAVSRAIHQRFPLTILVSNVGAAIGIPNGALVRGGNITLPNRFFSIGSVLGVFPIQDEVRAVDGQPVVRPTLPVSYVFDHRLFDGVAAGRVLTRFGEILADPAEAFGDDGGRVGPPCVGGRPGAVPRPHQPRIN